MPAGNRVVPHIEVASRIAPAHSQLAHTVAGIEAVLGIGAVRRRAAGRQVVHIPVAHTQTVHIRMADIQERLGENTCLLYTSDAADE